LGEFKLEWVRWHFWRLLLDGGAREIGRHWGKVAGEELKPDGVYHSDQTDWPAIEKAYEEAKKQLKDVDLPEVELDGK
jgi:hypothetical protein